jgi:hypothetical protein
MIGRRVMNLWRAVVGAELTQLEVRSAEALLDVEREELRRKIAQYNLGLAGYAAISEKLKTDIVRLSHERVQLEPKLRARLASGDRVAASRLALRLELIEDQIGKQQTQRDETELTYRELVRAREVALVAARDRMDTLKRDIGDLRVQEALADLTEMAAGMQGTIGLSDGTLERVQEGVNDKRNLAVGRARVARDAIDTTEVHAREVEHAALAEAALMRFEQRGTDQSAAAEP